jgi:tetratricopeptide (TPR) repeat protein
MPATVLLARRRVIWPVGVIGTASSAAVIVMGGSRTTWLALAAALIVLVILNAGSYRRTPKLVLLGAPILLAAGVIAAFPQLFARLATSSTVELRFAMWSDAIRAWFESPLTGSGPGTFASAFVMTGHYTRYEPYVPHAHNVPVQMLLETGIVGLIAVAVLVLSVVVGMRQGGRRDTPALIALTVVAVASLTETPTHGSFLVAPVIVWAAILVRVPPAPEVRTAPRRWLRVLHVAIAAGIAIAVSATLAAAAAHDRAAAAADARRDKEVVHELRAAAALDPSFAIYHRELGAWLLRTDPFEAVKELKRALDLNPTDQATLRSLALAKAEVGDRRGSVAAARLALDRADHDAENALTLSYVAERVGDDQAAWEGMVRATRSVPWILAAPEWDAVFPATAKAEILRDALESWARAPDSSYRNARARAWLSGMTGGPVPPDVGRPFQAEMAVLLCQPGLAADALDGLGAVERTTGDALQARVVFARAFGAEVDGVTQRMIRLRNTSLARQAFGGVIGASPLTDYTADVNVYRRIPIAPPDPIFPTGPSGLSVWLRDPVEAADLGAPGSPLAECR